MKPEDKAKQIFDSFLDAMSIQNPPDAKYMAIILVDSTIEALEHFGYAGSMFDDYETGKITTTDEKDPSVYWRQVKMEIEKL